MRLDRRTCRARSPAPDYALNVADDVPDHGRPIGPARPEVPVGGAGRASEWSIEWWGILPVLAIALAAIVGWRATGGTGTGPDEGRTGGVAVTTTEPVAAATTSAPATTTSTTVATTVPPTGTTEPAGPAEPTVHIVGEMKPCRFGDDCLVASFTIEGFDEPSGRFTCIYPNSTREFSFQDDGKDDACLTADEGDTITIEVDGVRSATVSEQDLDG